MEGLDEGETVCTIPWKLMITPSDETPWHEQECEMIENLYKEITKGEDEITPYAKYLLSQPRGYTPQFWSEAGKKLLLEMTNEQQLPPYFGIDDYILMFEENCGRHAKNQMHVFARMLVRARGDGLTLTPFYDMINHHNGKVNTLHRYSSKEVHEGTGLELYAGKNIQKNDQLFLSYNQETDFFDGWYDIFGTPEMFLVFGFVESFPQRWLFDRARIKFDLDWIDEGDENAGHYNVTFLVPPSKDGMDLLRSELAHLDLFEETVLKNNNNEGIPESEMISVREYYNALHLAIQLALDSSATALVDDVWEMGYGWWKTKDDYVYAADVDSHSNSPSELSNSEEL